MVKVIKIDCPVTVDKVANVRIANIKKALNINEVKKKIISNVGLTQNTIKNKKNNNTGNIVFKLRQQLI